MRTLHTGMKVVIIEGDNEIDVGMIIAKDKSPNLGIETVSFESLKLYPKKRSKFALMEEGWKLLFPDPFTGQLACGKSVAYKIKPSA
ncbi:MAG: hypothetical protein ACM3PZ_00045 [Bacillota bacterium]